MKAVLVRSSVFRVVGEEGKSLTIQAAVRTSCGLRTHGIRTMVTACKVSSAHSFKYSKTPVLSGHRVQGLNNTGL
jgi:hypothetical protein